MSFLQCLNKRRAGLFAAALLFILSGCQKNNWKSSSIQGTKAAFCSSRITRKALDNPYIEFELIRTHEGEKGYILFHVDKVHGSENHPDQVFATLLSDNQVEHTFTASKLRGGQRILLPSDVTSLILSKLSSGQKIEMVLGGYGIKISSDGFEEAFKKFKRPSPKFKLPNIAMDWSTN
jgi:hypothetical protein